MNLQSGTVRHAVQATVTFPSTPGVVAAPVKAVPLTRDRHVLVPVALALIGGLVLALILFFLWWRRRRRDDDEQSLDGAGPRLPGQRANDDERAHR
jgi:LPXTG-motif cell wall-anchored protein